MYSRMSKRYLQPLVVLTVSIETVSALSGLCNSVRKSVSLMRVKFGKLSENATSSRERRQRGEYLQPLFRRYPAVPLCDRRFTFGLWSLETRCLKLQSYFSGY